MINYVCFFEESLLRFEYQSYDLEILYRHTKLKVLLYGMLENNQRQRASNQKSLWNSHGLCVVHCISSRQVRRQRRQEYPHPATRPVAGEYSQTLLARLVQWRGEDLKTGQTSNEYMRKFCSSDAGSRAYRPQSRQNWRL